MNAYQAVPENSGRIYSPVYEIPDQAQRRANAVKGAALMVFSYILFALVCVVVLPVTGKVAAALGLLGYVLHVASRGVFRSVPSLDQSC